MINLASVHDVMRVVGTDGPKLSALRFRPNFIISGPAAYAEDEWKRIRIGSSEYYVSCRTMRCKLPNVDPETGIKHPVEPDKTMRSFRRIDDGDPQHAALGVQMVPAEKGMCFLGIRLYLG
jgi:uncharacterized protein YcbX